MHTCSESVSWVMKAVNVFRIWLCVEWEDDVYGTVLFWVLSVVCMISGMSSVSSGVDVVEH